MAWKRTPSGIKLNNENKNTRNRCFVNKTFRPHQAVRAMGIEHATINAICGNSEMRPINKNASNIVSNIVNKETLYGLFMIVSKTFRDLS